VLPLLDADNVGCAFVASEQILSVLGVEEFSQRLDAAHDRNNTCLGTAQIKHGVDEIVSRSLFTQLHLEALVEKLNKTVARVSDFSIGHFRPKPPHMHFEHTAR